MRRRACLAACAAATPLLLAACAAPQRVAERDASGLSARWTGRLSLRVDSAPPQSFAAMFELRGAPGRGELTLTSPIGTTLGVLRWSSTEAVLDDGRRSQRDVSIDALLERLTGAALPVDALFDWLAGRPTAVEGWRPQLDQVPSGRLQAVREMPAPVAELRLVFEHHSDGMPASDSSPL